MMNQQKSTKAGLLKYSLIVPLALALIVSSNAQTVVNNAKSMATKTVKALTASDTTNVSKKLTIKYDAPENTTGSEPVKTSMHFITQDDKSMDNKSVDSTKPPIKTSYKFTAPIIIGTVNPDLNKKTLDNQKVYNHVEKMPQYPGGLNELISYLVRSIKYPVEAQKNGVQGKVMVRFIVNSSGKIEQAEIAGGEVNNDAKGLVVDGNVGINKKDSLEISELVSNQLTLMKQEALRVVNAMPVWTPGEQKGEKVSVYYTLPINFRLK